MRAKKVNTNSSNICDQLRMRQSKIMDKDNKQSISECMTVFTMFI